METNKRKKLEVKDLRISFKTDHGLVQAVRNVSFDLYEGETLCIVGESGSGKSVTSKTIMGILANNAIVENGQINYEGENLLEVSEDEFYRIRGHKIGMIFQDPLSSLNPIVKIGKQITEATLINSNQLKLKYDEIISEELVAYKNAIAKANVLKKRSFEEYKKIKSTVAKKLKDASITLTSEEKNKLKNSVADAKANYKKVTKETNKNLKEQLVPLKAALNAKKKDAKVEVKKYKASILAEKAQKVAEITPKIETAKKEHNENLANLTQERAKIIQEYNDKLKTLKIELNKNGKNKTAAAYREFNKQKEEIIAEKNQKVADIDSKIATVKDNYNKIVQEKNNIIHTYDSKIKISKLEAKRRALEIMKEVGIPQPERRFNQYPFEFSGGMRQRIVIAIALTASPEILICDEPTTALDVTIQAQILELIKKIQKERNISCIFITHDLGVVANMADRVAVMYAGKIVEYGTSDEIFFEPKHPYTWALLSSIPDVDSKERLETIPGTPPNMIYPPKGDAFALRSKYAMKIDFEEEPPFFKVSDTHYAATWLLHPSAPAVEMPKIVKQRIENALKNKDKTTSKKKGGTINEQ